MSTYLAPISKPQITVDDWIRTFQHYQRNYEELTENACKLKNESHKIRDDSSVDTQWNVHFTNELLRDRMKEITDWKNEITNCIQSLNEEIKRLEFEKSLCEKNIDSLYPKFAKINECHALRLTRKKSDMCKDNVTFELHQEYDLLEKVKTELANKCEEAFNQITKMRNLISALEMDLDLKKEACEIEKQTLDLADIVTYISHKPDTDRVINYTSYNSWLLNCERLISETDSELRASAKLRKAMCVPRENARNLLAAQYEATNFAFRKRIYETRSVLDRLKWQKRNLETEKERLSGEMSEIRGTIKSENHVLKVIESQNRNRTYRANTELCQDDSTDNLNIQIFNLRNVIEKLNNQLERVKKTYDTICEQIQTTEEESKAKTWALNIDNRCLEIRSDPTI